MIKNCMIKHNQFSAVAQCNFYKDVFPYKPIIALLLHYISKHFMTGSKENIKAWKKQNSLNIFQEISH